MSRGLARRFALESRPGTVYSWSTAMPRGQDVAATELSLWEKSYGVRFATRVEARRASEDLRSPLLWERAG
jgi:hypothetical protein